MEEPRDLKLPSVQLPKIMELKKSISALKGIASKGKEAESSQSRRIAAGGCQPGICVSSNEPAIYRNSNIEKTAPEHLVSSQQRSGDLRHR